MNFRNLLQTRTARARGKLHEIKGRFGARGRGTYFGNGLSGMRWRVSKLRGRFPR